MNHELNIQMAFIITPIKKTQMQIQIWYLHKTIIIMLLLGVWSGQCHSGMAVVPRKAEGQETRCTWGPLIPFDYVLPLDARLSATTGTSESTCTVMEGTDDVSRSPRPTASALPSCLSVLEPDRLGLAPRRRLQLLLFTDLSRIFRSGSPLDELFRTSQFIVNLCA